MMTLRSKKTLSVRHRSEWIKREPVTDLGHRIVSATAEQFASKGIAGARVAAICRRAGTTEPSFYRYFAGMKQAALYIMSEYYWAPLNTRLRHYRQITQDPALLLETAIDALIQSANDDPSRPWLSETHVFRIVVVQMRNPFLLPDALEESEYMAFIQGIESIIEAGQKMELFASDLNARLLAQLLVINLHGLLMMNSLGRSAQTDVNEVRKVAAILVGAKGSEKIVV